MLAGTAARPPAQHRCPAVWPLKWMVCSRSHEGTDRGRGCWHRPGKLECLRQPGGHGQAPSLYPLRILSRLEASGSAAARTGWQPAHLVLEEDGAVTGILPAYLK